MVAAAAAAAVEHGTPCDSPMSPSSPRVAGSSAAAGRRPPQMLRPAQPRKSIKSSANMAEWQKHEETIQWPRSAAFDEE